MARGKGASILGTIIALFAIVLLVGYFAVSTGGLTSFQVKQGDVEITDKTEEMTLVGLPARFDVKFTLGAKAYDVRILPNPAADFDFYVEGQPKGFAGEKDLTPGFGLKVEETYFELSIPPDMAAVLSGVYGGKQVSVQDGVEISAKYYFMLSVTSGGKEIRVLFRPYARVSGIELKPGEVLFW